ncbi:MAG: glutamate racemase [Bacteroidales bacterium]|nr:glutamate racemase [Bacteroidales bacterium]
MAVIGIMDSGSGGLSVYREIAGILPGHRYIYYADNANCPYGTKSQEFITGRADAITEHFLSKGADAVVIACNTATAAAIAHLRANYDIPFVGMEPAVKPAALGTRSGIIGVLATAGTLKASKYLDTRDRYSGGIKVIEHVGEGFVELVENLELEGPHAEEVVRNSLQPLIDAGADTVVLGCTHYPFLLPLMKRLAPKGIRFIDPAPAVARQLQRVLAAKGLDAAGNGSGLELESSAPSRSLAVLAEISK